MLSKSCMTNISSNMLIWRTCRLTNINKLSRYASNGRTSVAVSSNKNKNQSTKTIELQPLKVYIYI